MITVYPFDSLGTADYGWLKARYHFSFASYDHPLRRGFGTLLVINDDAVAPGRGFPPHPHRDMEIITYVRQGAIAHRDSTGNAGSTGAGEVQVMSAGTGIAHSEHNETAELTRLYQIWIVPDAPGGTPRWDQRRFPQRLLTEGALPVLVSGTPTDDALLIRADAVISGGRAAAGALLRQPIRHQAYVLASAGSFTVNGTRMNAGDGAEVTKVQELEIAVDTPAEILVIDVPELRS